MPRQNASTFAARGLCIAGVCFKFSPPVDETDFSPSFSPFLTDVTETETDLRCEVVCRGPDDLLAAQTRAPDRPWSFVVRENECEVVRRNEAGDALWKISGSLPFDRITVSWHPVLFADFYSSYGRAWTTGLGLSLLVLCLRSHGGLVLHGTAAEVEGQGILCAGVSGKGKSTLARLLDTAGATVLTDERPVVRQWPTPDAAHPANFRAYGSPWPSSAGFARNQWASLRRIYFIEHGEADRIIPLTPKEAVCRLIHVATFPWQDPHLLDPYLATVESMLRTVPCAVLSFRPTPNVVDTIRNDLRALKKVSSL